MVKLLTHLHKLLRDGEKNIIFLQLTNNALNVNKLWQIKKDKVLICLNA